jgi:ribosomal protein S6--L-glutamate ligase
MRFCFILEEAYQDDEMPRAVAECVRALGHRVDLLEPHASVTELGARSALEYDAYVLKTAPDGPGLSLLEAAGAAGIPTINPWRSIRLVRNKAVAVAVAMVRHLYMPRTFFVSAPNLLRLIAPYHYPLVVKPNQGGAGRAVFRVDHPDQLALLTLDADRHFVAQSYVDNAGFDVKVYNTGRELFAVQWPSPLHPEVPVTPRLLPLTPELRDIALAFGRAFGLKIYGVDLVPTQQGWIAVDVNDFPSFHEVPDAAARVAVSVLQMAASKRRSPSERRRSNGWTPPQPAPLPVPANPAPNVKNGRPSLAVPAGDAEA